MKLGVVTGFLLLTGCAGTPTDNTAAVDRACSVADCFLDRDVRDFEVIEKTTLIVYIGSQRCAFKVDLRGTFCDLTFAPDIFFHDPNDITASRPGDRIFDSTARASNPGGVRVCANDLQIDVDGGVFTETQSSSMATPKDRLGNARSQCQVAGVTSLTDDQLVELYVAHGAIPPPPPMGAGEIEVGAQEEPITPSEPGEQTEPTATQLDEEATANAN